MKMRTPSKEPAVSLALLCGLLQSNIGFGARRVSHQYDSPTLEDPTVHQQLCSLRSKLYGHRGKRTDSSKAWTRCLMSLQNPGLFSETSRDDHWFHSQSSLDCKATSGELFEAKALQCAQLHMLSFARQALCEWLRDFCGLRQEPSKHISPDFIVPNPAEKNQSKPRVNQSRTW